MASSNLRSYHDACVDINEVISQRLSNISWQSPSAGFFKVNVDFASFQASNSFGLGMVIRDERGRFIAPRTQKLGGEVDPYVGKF